MRCRWGEGDCANDVVVGEGMEDSARVCVPYFAVYVVQGSSRNVPIAKTKVSQNDDKYDLIS